MNNQEEEKLENQIVENQNESPEVAENVENLGENLDSAETKTEEVAEETETKDETQTSNHVLRVSSLYKAFGKKQVVRGVDFSMNMGEILGLLGPNGAGKTTTFYMVVGFYKPTNGDVFLDDKCITNLPMYKRARLGISYLPQEPSVFKKLTVEENIWSVLETRKDLSYKEKKIKNIEYLAKKTAREVAKTKVEAKLDSMNSYERRIVHSLLAEDKYVYTGNWIYDDGTPVSTPISFIVINFACCSDYLGFLWVRRCDKIWVNSYTMAAYATTWLQNIYTRMFIRQINQFPNVNTSFIT